MNAVIEQKNGIEVLTKSQKKTFKKTFREGGKSFKIMVNIRYDDECGNGHNTFSITGDIWQIFPKLKDNFISGGCIHDEIKKHFPEFKHLIKWHLVSSDGPMHYIPNVLYFADDRDYNGLKKGEKRQLKDKNGKLAWIKKGTKTEYFDGDSCPSDNTIVKWEAWYIIGEGKERELDKAREAAIWPDATDAELTDPGLKERLEARLPELLKKFKSDIESLGFIY